jgi:hypothetical protein
MTNLLDLIEASEHKTQKQFILRMNIWASQMGLLKLLRSLEGGTRVQQIIIGYFVAPISYIMNN